VTFEPRNNSLMLWNEIGGIVNRATYFKDRNDKRRALGLCINCSRLTSNLRSEIHQARNAENRKRWLAALSLERRADEKRKKKQQDSIRSKDHRKNPTIPIG